MKKLFYIVCLLAIACMYTSCATNGYGCHGRAKYITRVKSNGYN